MIERLAKVLSEDEIEKIKSKVTGAGDAEKAWKALAPLLRAQHRQREAAICLLEIVDGRSLSFERAIEVLEALFESYEGNQKILGYIGDATSGARDIDVLNLEAPEHPFFERVVTALTAALKTPESVDVEKTLLRGLAVAARMMSRQHDDLAESSAKRLIELEPEHSSNYYNYGLWCKTRGKFREGLAANQTARNLSKEVEEAYEWNLGICATGAGESAVALDVWKRMKNKIEIGRFGLPDGKYGQVKVRLCQRPLAERNRENDSPGLEETIWIERLSPCHGIVRSVLYYRELGVDYGDVILFDGAPITYHKYGDEKIPVFPHLATLVRQHYQFYDFAGTQDKANRIFEINEELDSEAIVYSHTENFEFLCSACWRDQENDHKHEKERKSIVRGRIAASRDYPARELLAQIDKALSKREPCKIYSPALCEAAGLYDRAKLEVRRFTMLKSN